MKAIRTVETSNSSSTSI